MDLFELTTGAPFHTLEDLHHPSPIR